MVQPRRKFHEDLDWLERQITMNGELAERAVGRAVEALATQDPAIADEVIAGDDLIDEGYVEVERRVLDIIAMQNPVASDLRFVSAVWHINLHLERIGDMAVNIAKIAKVTGDLPRDERVISHLREMADVVRPMIRTVMEAFALRDLELALKLPSMDDPVDRLNRGLYGQIVALSPDVRLLEWGIRMNVVSRQLERCGDHAVDIAEQVAFLLTGEFREFTDASHPPELGPDAS
jgi:phosphate transport system protein